MSELGLQRNGPLRLQVEGCLQVSKRELQAGNSLFQFPRFREFVGGGAKKVRNCRLAFRRHCFGESYRRFGVLSLATNDEVEKTRATAREIG